jgi:hypothetical protein
MPPGMRSTLSAEAGETALYECGDRSGSPIRLRNRSALKASSPYRNNGGRGYILEELLFDIRTLTWKHSSQSAFKE